MPDDKPRLTRKQLIGMFALGVAVFIVANDFTAFSVALPAMEKSLKTDISTIQWVINGYTLIFAAFLVTGGRLADKFGRRRVFLIGAGLFAGFSLVAGLSNRIELVLLSRGVMGIGGAMMWPATIGMIYALVPPERAGLAGGLVMGVSGLGNATGPLLGGVLTDLLSWHWIFLINIPIAVLGASIVLIVIEKDTPADDHERFDFVGVTILTIALFSLLLSLDLGGDMGWTDPVILALFATAGVGIAVFALVERKVGERALIPPSVAGNKLFAVSSAATLLSTVTFFAVVLYVPQFLTKNLHFSAMKSGVGFLPMMLTFAVTSVIAGNLYEKLGAKLSVSIGAALLAVGMLLLARIDPGTQYVSLLPGLVVLGIGTGLFFSSITTAAITTLDASRMSLGGAIIYMFIVGGGAVGLGFNTAIVVSAKDLATGISHAFLLNSVLCAVSLVLALLFIHAKKTRGGSRHGHRHLH